MTKSCRFSLLIAMAGITLLTIYGCWIPLNFEAEIQVNADGSYILKYDGELMFARALSMLKGGPLARKDEDDIKKIVDQMRQLPGYKRVTYLNNGRCKIVIEKSMKSGEPYIFMSQDSKTFTIQPQKDGTLNLATSQFSPTDLNTLKTIGARTSGRLTVSVAPGVKVLKHNAQFEDKGRGSFSRYVWKIDSLDANPMILVKPAA